MTQTWDAKLQGLLDSLQGHFEVCELDLPESPVFIALAIPLSAATTGLRPRLPAGRGLTSAQAMHSAAAESLELLACLAQSCERDRNQFRVANGLAEVEAQNISNGSSSFFSAQRIYLDWAASHNEKLIHDADTNGCACGNTWSRAVNSAVLEVIERDAMAIWWFGRQRRNHLAVSCLDRLAPRLSWWLSNRPKQSCLIDVTSEVGVPVIAAISHSENGRRIAIGSAAALDIEQAAVLAVTEMVQMEVSMALGSPDVERENWLANASVHNMQQFHPNPVNTEVSAPPVGAQNQLVAAGHQVFAIDLTRTGDLLSTARVIVPTLSPYHRTPDISRIVTQSLKQPQFHGIENASDIEVLAPY